MLARTLPLLALLVTGCTYQPQSLEPTPGDGAGDRGGAFGDTPGDADLSGVVVVFRSVGPGNSSPLDAGSDLSIAGDIATFAGPVHGFVGRGDILQYDHDGDGTIDSLAMVTERRGPDTELLVLSTDGRSNPTPTTGATWELFRAYTSLHDAEKGAENPGIDAGLRNFDTFSGGRDLVGNGERWVIACYGDGVDIVPVVVDGWNTNALHNLRILTPFRSHQVRSSQRHRGLWTDSAYQLVVTDQIALAIRSSHVSIEGLQIGLVLSDTGGHDAVHFDFDSGYSVVRDSILHATSPTQVPRSVLMNASPAGATAYVIDNVIYATGTSRTGILTTSGRTVAYNNTVVACSPGIDAGTGDVVVVNNLVDSPGTGFAGTFNTSDSSHNLSNDSSAPGSSSRQGAAVFLDSADFHLDPADSEARDRGADLSVDAIFRFSNDIDGEERVGDWDIGADQCDAVGTDVAATYPNSPDWNDYVADDGAALWASSGTTCTNVAGVPCLHAGELREVFVPNATSCEGLEARDDLRAFNWICVAQNTEVWFYSTDLADGMGLRDLFDTNGWHDNRVLVLEDGHPLAASDRSTWWSNPVITLPDNSTGGGASSLTTMGAIYVLDSTRATGGYRMANERQALVTLPGTTLLSTATPNCDLTTGSTAGTDKCMVVGRMTKHLWIEADLDVTNADQGIILHDAGHSRIHQTTVTNVASYVGIRLASSYNDTLTFVTVSNVFEALYLLDSSYNRVAHLSVQDGVHQGVNVNGDSHDNSLTWVDVTNTPIGMDIQTPATNNRVLGLSVTGATHGLIVGGGDNVIQDVAAANVGNNGVWIDDRASGNVLTTLFLSECSTGVRIEGDGTTLIGAQVVSSDQPFILNGASGVGFALTAANGSTTGIDIVSPAQSWILGSVLTANNGGDGIRLDAGTLTLYGAGFIRNNNFGLNVTSNATAASAYGPVVGGDNNGGNCQIGISNSSGNLLQTSNCQRNDGSDPLVAFAVSDLTQTFAGPVLSDLRNFDDAMLQTMFGSIVAGDITDWLTFSSPFRAWGRAGQAEQLSIDNRGRCQSSNDCGVWDWRLRGTSTPVRLASGDVVEGAVCPPLANQTIPDTNAYLAFAAELINDGSGNDNGRCETGEHCLYLANLGSYQGDGAPARRCIFADGIVTGVSLWGLWSNGTP